MHSKPQLIRIAAQMNAYVAREDENDIEMDEDAPTLTISSGGITSLSSFHRLMVPRAKGLPRHPPALPT